MKAGCRARSRASKRLAACELYVYYATTHIVGTAFRIRWRQPTITCALAMLHAVASTICLQLCQLELAATVRQSCAADLVVFRSLGHTQALASRAELFQPRFRFRRCALAIWKSRRTRQLVAASLSAPHCLRSPGLTRAVVALWSRCSWQFGINQGSSNIALMGMILKDVGLSVSAAGSVVWCARVSFCVVCVIVARCQVGLADGHVPDQPAQ